MEEAVAKLDTGLNTEAEWNKMQTNAKRRVEIDLNEVNAVIELARRTPGLREYEDELHKLSIFFEFVTQYYRVHNPDALADFVEFWERYRSVVIQRYAAITPVELRAADLAVGDIFKRFLGGIPNENVSYSPDAQPLVWGGEGGPDNYYTYPPGENRPFGIINLPHAAFDNVWRWLALPHETGHDTYASVHGLKDDIEGALAARMDRAVDDGEVTIPDVDLNSTYRGYPYQIKYSGKEFLETIWRAWANEAQADLMGLLSCGGAAAIGLQQIIEFRAYDLWDVFFSAQGVGNRPEEHPTSYVRNALNIAMLRRIGGGHNEIANEIQDRFDSLKPDEAHLTWYVKESDKVIKVPIDEMVKSAEIAAEVLVNEAMPSLGNQSYREICDFTANDQKIVDNITDLLVAGDPRFAQVENSTPRHALAATVFAFERDRTKADLINRTFKNFVM